MKLELKWRRDSTRWGLAAAGLLTLSALSTPARACGGLFCSSANPVNQAAERIVFSKNSNGTITTIVQIDYAGPAEKFAWVLPIPGIPDVSVSSTLALDRLQQATNPTYRLNNTFTGDCSFALASPSSGTGGATAGVGGSAGNSGPVVTVVKAGSVGPYDFEVISVEVEDEDPAQVAIDWMESNEYDIDSLGADVLRPYLQNGMNLVAVKLAKDAMVGSIRPLSLTYESEVPAIPIRPTAVAANDDMGILVWVLGEHRAVPTNYKGLELNELLIDWFNPNSTYSDVVSLAADEADGQGFVTEFAGSSNDSAQPIVLFTEADAQRFQPIEEELDLWFTLELSIARYASFEGFVDALRETLQLREGVAVEDFIECSTCYFNGYNSLAVYQAAGSPELVPSGLSSRDEDLLIGDDDPIFETDLAAMKAELQAQVLEPLRQVDALVKKSQKITRLYTTMSADEMTVDPMFDFNADLEDYSNIHILNRVQQCGNSEWEATFDDGQIVTGSGNVWPFTLADVGPDFPAAAQIVQFSTAGLGEIIVDNKKKMDEMAAGDEMQRMMSGQGGAGSMSNQSGGALSADSDKKAEAEKNDTEENTSTEGPDESGDPGKTKFDDSSGCSIATAPLSPNSWGAWGLLALASSLLMRRRKSHQKLPC